MMLVVTIVIFALVVQKQLLICCLDNRIAGEATLPSSRE
jgi:hypothetical protein